MTELILSREIRTLRKFDSDMKWFQAHYEALKRKYKGQYVAVKGGKVIDHDEDADQLLRRLKQRYGDTSSMVIEPISARQFRYVL